MPKSKRSIVTKSHELSNLDIEYVSMVDKASNGIKWLVAKSKGGKDQFTIGSTLISKSATQDELLEQFGIEKTEGQHFVLAPVYMPLTADSDDEFASAEEIAKAMENFNENHMQADTQHNYQVNEEINIVKSWLLEEELTTQDINGNDVTLPQGTWMMAAEVSGATWESVEKNEFTGWSMGGTGSKSTVDVNLDEIEKSVGERILTKLNKVFGGYTADGTPIDETSFDEQYNEQVQIDAFWTAWNILNDLLAPFTSEFGWDYELQEDPQIISNALSQFTETVSSILIDGQVMKSFKGPSEEVHKSINKAGKVLSTANETAIQGAIETLNNVLATTTPQVENENGGEDEVNKQEVKEMIEKANQPILDAINKLAGEEEPEQTEVSKTEGEGKEKTLTTEDVQKMITEGNAPILEAISNLQKSKKVVKSLNTETVTKEETKTKVEKSDDEIFSGCLFTSAE